MAADELSPSLADMLFRARSARGMTLRAAARAAGVSNPYLSQIETGKIKQPSAKVLGKLAESYGMDPGELMRAAGYPWADEGDADMEDPTAPINFRAHKAAEALDRIAAEIALIAAQASSLSHDEAMDDVARRMAAEYEAAAVDLAAACSKVATSLLSVDIRYSDPRFPMPARHG